MKRSSLSPACLLFLALVVITFFVPRDLAAQSAVPFRATIAITESIQFIGTPPCISIGDVTGKGTATHLGKVTLDSNDCINPINPTFTAFSFFSNGPVVLTVATGEQITARYSGTLVVEGSVGIITGGYEITGGTGRYVNATGAGAVKGVEDMNTGKGQIQLNGTISY
ncbi:MAG TPA: hypothetical protein VJQ55_16190 [Candidatus Binatia bacterium]|nr:hypothetical protein [Candidatus Binatia bacterium]